MSTSHLGTGWQDQRARLGRWHKRLFAIGFGIPTDISKAEALDFVFVMRPTRASKPDGYLLGSYRIATAPDPNSSRLTSFKSTCRPGDSSSH